MAKDEKKEKAVHEEVEELLKARLPENEEERQQLFVSVMNVASQVTGYQIVAVPGKAVMVGEERGLLLALTLAKIVR